MHYLTSYHYPKIHWECSVLGIHIDDIITIRFLVSKTEWTNGTQLTKWNEQIFREGCWYIDGIRIIYYNADREVIYSTDQEYSFILYIQGSKALKAALS